MSLNSGSCHRLSEVNLLGVYVAPISVTLVAAWPPVIAMRRIAAHFGLLHHAWHPALFVAAIYVIVLSFIVLVAGS